MVPLLVEGYTARRVGVVLPIKQVFVDLITRKEIRQPITPMVNTPGDI